MLGEFQAKRISCFTSSFFILLTHLAFYAGFDKTFCVTLHILLNLGQNVKTIAIKINMIS